jgi:carbonic anhydrase/acetyltransferase-like protein (isoleucine patch superfamily)
MKAKEALKKALRRNPSMALAVARAYRFALGVRASMALFFRFPAVYIASDVLLIGVSRIRIGSDVAIGSGSWLNVNDRNSPLDGLVIGDNCFIGKRNFFSVGRSIILRDYCLTALNCAFIGSSHRYDDPMSAYMTTGVTLDADIYVGANCFFGYGSQVIGNVRIGHGCVIGAGALIRSDIPPFSLAVGNPASVIKRFDFSSMQWVAWPANSITEGPSEEAYIEHLRRQHGFVIQPVSVAASSFGNIL